MDVLLKLLIFFSFKVSLKKKKTPLANQGARKREQK
jgi:hypothetical protein